MDLNESIPYQLRNKVEYFVYIKYKLRHLTNLNNIVRYHKIGKWIPSEEKYETDFLAAKAKSLVIEAAYIRYPLNQICIRYVNDYNQFIVLDHEIDINNWSILQVDTSTLPCSWLLDISNVRMYEYTAVVLQVPSLCDTF